MPTILKPLPLRISPIDWSNPLTKDLVFDWKNNARSPRLPIDNVKGRRGVVVNSPSELLRRIGSGIDFGTTASYQWFDRDFTNFERISFECIYIRDGSGSNGYGTAFVHGDSTTGLPWFMFSNDNGDAGWGHKVQFGYSNRERVFSLPYPTNEIVHHTIMTYDHTNYNNTPLVWHDGKAQSLNDRYNAGVTWTINANDIHIGDSMWTGGTEVWDGAIFLCRYWKRQLTAREVYMLFENAGRIYKSSPVFGKAPSGGNNYTQTLPEVITVVDTLTKQPGKDFDETVTVVDTLAKAFTRSLSEVVTLEDTIRKATTKVLSETITLVDTVSKLPGKVLSEAITIVDSISTTVPGVKNLFEQISLTDSMSMIFNSLSAGIPSKFKDAFRRIHYGKPEAGITSKNQPEGMVTEKNKPEGDVT